MSTEHQYSVVWSEIVSIEPVDRSTDRYHLVCGHDGFADRDVKPPLKPGDALPCFLCPEPSDSYPPKES